MKEKKNLDLQNSYFFGVKATLPLKEIRHVYTVLSECLPEKFLHVSRSVSSEDADGDETEDFPYQNLRCHRL
jgi:hypothetical protein